MKIIIKIISLMIFCFLLFSGIIPNVISTKVNSQYFLEKPHLPSDKIFYHDNINNVLINLDLDGLTYGHELLWRANTTGTNYEESAVVYYDGVAYISSCSTHGEGHDKIFAVNTLNGEIIWSTHIGPGYVGPIIDNDRIYIGTSSHGYDPANEYVYCINRSNGNIIWSRNIYGGIPESIQYDNDNIYFTSDIIYALNKYDGSILWTYPMDSFSVTKPLLKDNAFITATSGGRMYKINVDNGAKIWEVSLSDFSWDNSITADGKGHIFLALYADRTINSYDESTGELLWSYRLNDRSLSFNAYHNDILFISDLGGYVYALNSSTGDLIWEKKVGDTFDISSPSISGGLLFIGTRDFEDGAFYVLNETNGDIIWKYKISASITAPPSIVDGMMLCGTDDWNMYAFDFGVGHDDWLLSRYDKSNTAYSPNGLTEWQYVSASCSTFNNTTTCIIKNLYDHNVSNVELQLPDDIYANWYDSLGNLLKPQSDNYMIDELTSLTDITLIIKKDLIHKPNKPILTGPTTGIIGNQYNYTVSTFDLDGDEISYYIDWGDNTDTGWSRTLPSGENLTVSHSWNNKNTYYIRAKAKDTSGFESEWSDPLIVSMPKDSINENILFFRFFNLLKNLLLLF